MSEAAAAPRAMPRVLLLHGPLDSVGVNLVSQRLHPDTINRAHAYASYHCAQNINALANAFRVYNFKICYSGWNEDREWLEANRELFDYLVISDQTNLKSENVREGFVIPNNKEKFYFAAYQGLQEIKKHEPDNAQVFRLRSDIAIRPDLAAVEVAKAMHDPDVVRIEYLNGEKMWVFPDFMMLARLDLMHEIYQGMYERSISGNAYHISSHVDHSLTCIKLKQAGRVSAIHCMSRALFDSVVWRGIPRYFEAMFGDVSKHLIFEAALNLPADLNVEKVVNSVGDIFSGKRRD